MAEKVRAAVFSMSASWRWGRARRRALPPKRPPAASRADFSRMLLVATVGSQIRERQLRAPALVPRREAVDAFVARVVQRRVHRPLLPGVGLEGAGEGGAFGIGGRIQP